MKISIACDHGGFKLKSAVKTYLENKGYEVVDFGCYDEQSVDYPVFAAKAAHAVADGEVDTGIVVCTTGIGVSIVANKVKGIRCALCTDEHLAEMTRRHNNANMLSLGADSLSEAKACRIADVFLTTEFEGDRHTRRVNLITAVESGEL